MIEFQSGRLGIAERRLLILILLCGSGLFYFVTLGQMHPNNTLFAEDQALTTAVISAMHEGEFVLLGPPSHIGGRHIGPAFYWIVSAIARLLGGYDWSVLVAMSLLSYVGIVAGWILVGQFSSISRHRIACSIAAIIIAIAGNGVYLVRLPWHANSMLTLTALVLACAFQWYLGSRTAGLFCSVFGVALTQYHFSAGPLVVLLLLGGLIRLGVRQSDAYKASVGAISICLLIGISLLLLVPPILYELWYPSNLKGVLQGLLDSSHSGQHVAVKAGVVESVTLFFRYALDIIGGEVINNHFARSNGTSNWHTRVSVGCGRLY